MDNLWLIRTHRNPVTILTRQVAPLSHNGVGHPGGKKRRYTKEQTEAVVDAYGLWDDNSHHKLVALRKVVKYKVNAVIS